MKIVNENEVKRVRVPFGKLPGGAVFQREADSAVFMKGTVLGERKSCAIALDDGDVYTDLYSDTIEVLVVEGAFARKN